MTNTCGTYASFQREQRLKRLGRPNCGPCESCREAERVYNRKPQVRARRAATQRRRAQKADAATRYKEHDKAQRSNYGISLAQKDLIFQAQGSCCGLCGCTAPDTSRGWFTEHDHDSGEVRGVVCMMCNMMIGYADKIRRLHGSADLYIGPKIIEYLNNGATRVKETLARVFIESVIDVLVGHE